MNQSARQESNITPFFRTQSYEDVNASEREKRPMFKEREVVEVRIAGDRHYSPVFPAHAMYIRQDGEEITYAMRWPEQYARFKDGHAQVADGTPLDELPFLSAAQRSTCKALKVYTAESLATLEGKNLRNLGPDGAKMKQQAQEYINSARGFADNTQAAQENQHLKAQVETLRKQLLQAQQAETPADEKPLLDGAARETATLDLNSMADAEVKAWIKTQTGSAPKGNPSRDTLLSMARQVAFESEAA